MSFWSREVIAWGVIAGSGVVGVEVVEHGHGLRAPASFVAEFGSGYHTSSKSAVERGFVHRFEEANHRDEGLFHF